MSIIALFSYLWQVSLGSAVGYGIYYVLLRNTTWFAFNRFYLLWVALGSAFLPLLPRLMPDLARLPLATNKTWAVAAQLPTWATTANTEMTYQWLPMALYIILGSYILGIIWGVYRLLTDIFRLKNLLKTMRPAFLEGYYIAETTAYPTFSFWNTLVLNRQNLTEEQVQQIVCHEITHLRQRHTLDLIACKIIGVLQWYNPFYNALYLALQDVHEYLADDSVIRRQTKSSKQYAQLLIQQAFMDRKFNCVHTFSNNQIKKRIIMMKQNSIAKGLPLLPIFALFIGIIVLGAIACTNPNSDIIDTPIQAKTSTSVDGANKGGAIHDDTSEQMPEFEGGHSALFEFLGKNIVYPVKARKNGIEGTVYIQFTVDENGSVITPEIRKGVSPELDEEALRVVKTMPRWTPGIKQGKAVKTEYTLPIKFKLQ